MPLRFAEIAPEAYRFPLTIRHLLDTALQTSRDQQIVYRDKVTLTYADFEQRIGRLASALTALGAAEGTTVAVLDWDSHRYLEAYFAVPMMGAVLQTVNIRLSPAQIRYTLDHAGAEVLIVHRDFLQTVEDMLAELPRVRAIVTIDDGETPPADRHAGEYEALLAAADPAFHFVDFDEDALATTFYTTGTTGLPKAVAFSHRQLVLHSLALCGPFGGGGAPGFGYGDVYMPMTPMFHVHAWGVPYVATMLGLKQVYPGRYEPDLLLDLRERHGATYSHCVPTILQMILAAAAKRDMRLDGWRMTIGGSMLTQALAAEARAAGIDVVAGYGMSETCPMVAHARPDPGDADDEAAIASLTAAGVPVPLVSIRIVDEDMRELPRDGRTRGELVVRTPWLTMSYGGDAKASAALWRGGWMHTQDVATIDEAGRLRIRDRLKDVIKTGGEWVCSLTLEDMIAEVDGVVEVAVIGVADAKWGERPIAVVVPAAGAVVDKESVNARLGEAAAAGEISRYALMDRVAIVDALPRTSVGKIDKKALRQAYAAA